MHARLRSVQNVPTLDTWTLDPQGTSAVTRTVFGTRAWWMAVSILLVTCATLGWAQERPVSTNPAVLALEATFADLLGADLVRSPDEPSWAALAEAADDLVSSLVATGEGRRVVDPAEAEALRLQADVYGAIGWWSRSLAAWERLRALDDVWTPWDAGRWSDVVQSAAYARYEAGDLEAAAAFFASLIEADPEDVAATSWRARIALERNEPEAEALWRRVLVLDPSFKGGEYHLALARERATWGVEASEAFRKGWADHDKGDLDAAALAFERASEAAPAWTEAIRWQARAILESGRAAASVPVWERALASSPADEGLAWWLERARLEARVGAAAAAAADEARRASAAGDASGAAAWWSEARRAAPGWSDARLEEARALLAAGDAERAIDAWTAILADAGGDAGLRAEARASIDSATLLATLSPEAAEAVAAALRDFQRGDAAAARVALVDVVSRWPDATLAWGWLGNVAFAERDYVTAATAYQAASAFDPTDDDLAFFAEEARRLAEAHAATDAP